MSVQDSSGGSAASPPPEGAAPASPPPRRRASRIPSLLVLVLLGGIAAGIGWVAASAWRQAQNAPAAASREVGRDWLPPELPRRADLRFRLETLDGKRIGPRDFAGKVVVVEFGATWCLPCHLQARVLESVQRDYGPRGLQVLTVDVGEPREVVERFYAQSPAPYPILLDPDDTTSVPLRVSVLPTLLVLDREGRVVYLRSGIADRRTLDEVVRAAKL